MENNENTIVEESTEEALNESVTESSEETGTEVLETTAEIQATVSSGDSYEAGIGESIVEVALSTEYITLIEENNKLLQQLVENSETETMTIMEKPLADYTATDGLLLITVVFITGIILAKIIGGIIPCKQ